MMRLAVAALALSTLSTLTACGGSDGSDDADASGEGASQGTESTTSTSSGEPTVEQAGQAFLALAQPVNDAIARLNQLSGSGTVEQFNDACALVADAQSTFIEEAGDATWPAEADDLVDELVRGTEGMRTHIAQCAKADDHAAVRTSLDEAVRIAPTAEAAAVRNALGLPAQ